MIIFGAGLNEGQTMSLNVSRHEAHGEDRLGGMHSEGGNLRGIGQRTNGIVHRKADGPAIVGPTRTNRETLTKLHKRAVTRSRDLRNPVLYL